MSLGAATRRLIARGDLPGSDGGIYNPGALLAGGSVLLLCRREVDHRLLHQVVFPELVVLDRRTLDLVAHRTLRKVDYPQGMEIEDFRCIEFGGMRLVVHTTVIGDRIKPAISRMFGDTLQRFDDFELPWKLNRVEKNWVLFEHDGALHGLYRLDPLTIFRRREDGSWQLIKDEDNGWSTPLGGMLSNSTNLIPFDGGYLGFWHTIIGGRYIQGAFLLGPDLSIRYKTGTLLDGAGVRHGRKRGVIYVSALVEDRGQILAFYGEGDAHTGVAVFDRNELSQELRRGPFVATESIRVRFEGGSLSAAFRAMQKLHHFSERRRHPRIRLYVTEPSIRQTLERLAPPNVLVRESGPSDRCHYTLSGSEGGCSLATIVGLPFTSFR